MNYLVFAAAVGSIRYVLTLILFKDGGISGVYNAWVLSWIAEAVVCVFIYLSGSWKKVLKKQEF